MRDRAGVGLAVVVLAGHAFVAFRIAHTFLGLPMEAGGLFLGPVIGLPLAGFAFVALALAVMLLVKRDAAWTQAVAALAVSAFFDAFLGMAGMPLLFLSAAAALTAAGLLVPWRGLRLY